MKFNLGARQIIIALIPAAVFTILFPILILLGFWQLNRAKEKSDILVTQEQRKSQADLELHAQSVANLDSMQYRKALLVGEYDSEHQFLLDNKIMEGKIGYYVLTPFKFKDSNKAILINRGWVPANPIRTQLPELDFVSGEMTLRGRINAFPGVGLVLSGAETPCEGWPSVLQLVSIKELEKKLGYELFDLQIELDNKQQHGFRREWKTFVTIPPEKHYAYAMQWFGLALTLLILFLVYGVKNESRR